MCVELGEVYRFSICDAGDAIELRLYENREGKEKDFEWGIAGEVIAKRVKNLGGVVCACYSPTMKRLCVKICKKTEALDSTVRAILDIAGEVLAKYMTPIGKAKLSLEDYGIQPL